MRYLKMMRGALRDVVEGYLTTDPANHSLLTGWVTEAALKPWEIIAQSLEQDDLAPPTLLSIAEYLSNPSENWDNPETFKQKALEACQRAIDGDDAVTWPKAARVATGSLSLGVSRDRTLLLGLGIGQRARGLPFDNLGEGGNAAEPDIVIRPIPEALAMAARRASGSRVSSLAFRPGHE